MSLEFRIAKTEEEKNLAYKIRYKVFCEELRYLDEHLLLNKLEKDEFDDLETTIHFIALKDSIPIATVRLLTPNNEMTKKQGYFGLSIEKYFDLSFYKGNNIKVAEISRSSVIEKERGKMNILHLWMLVAQYSISKDIFYLPTCAGTETDCSEDVQILTRIAKEKRLFHPFIFTQAKENCTNKSPFRYRLYENSSNFVLPKTLELYVRMGARFTGNPLFHTDFKMYTIPMVWDLNNIGSPFKYFLKRKNSEKI